MERKLRILLADDDPMNRKMAAMCLSRLGYTADMVSNGAEAVEAVEQNSYDLVLMDVEMPRLNGIEATQEISRRFGKNKPVIVALTASASHGDKEMLLSKGLQGYLTKPIVMDDLSSLLEKWKNELDD